MSKNVLLTGGAGFIGHLVIKEILVNTDWNLIVIDRLSYAGNLERINEVLGEVDEDSKKRVNFFYHDLKAEPHEGIIDKLSEVNIILHIGASSHVTRSVKNPLVFVQDNILGTFNLLEFARKLENLELFYYFSTDEVFGPSEADVKFLEWDRYNSKNPYSATKAAAEELTIAYANTYSIPSLITHCSNVYGERQHSEKFIPNTIKKILNDEEILIHTDSNNIPGSRYYIYNQDLVKSILFLTKNFSTVREKAYEAQKKEPTKVNITGASLISNLEVAELISKKLNKDFKFQLQNKDPDRPGHDIKYGLDNTLLTNLGGVFDRDFEKGIDETVDWYLNNKSWL
jgi:dTDP-glucose 4,6-dehydratase|tara:strand:+ start:584 stop:1609 length:1026 start_codon:yes stop_codon:yes gene_type:complete